MQQKIHTGDQAFSQTLRDMIRHNNPQATEAEIEDGIAHGDILEHPFIYQLFPKLGLSLLLPEANLLERNRVIEERLSYLGCDLQHACYRPYGGLIHDIIFDPSNAVYYCCIRDLNSWVSYYEHLTANGN